ncbi:MAG: hypothetical protein HY710_00385, partial [Candidatus Latescibacteria bacterium]|nr:hypothetical protein [Candidatus Latescibacterota bacterium]
MAPSSLLPLDGDWLLATDPENAGIAQQWWAGPTPDAKQTPVPWIIQDAFPGYHGVAWYWRDFVPPDNPHEHGRSLLRFWAVDYKADVWLNGVPVGGHEGGETPFILDVTDAIRPKQTNHLAVRVLNPTNDPIDGIVLIETPHRNKAVPHYVGGSYNYGGIVESVELLIVPAVRIEDVFVRPDPQTGIIRVQVNIHNATTTTTRGRLRITIAPAATGETLTVAQTGHDLPSGETRVETQIQVHNYRLWDLDDPFLYRVTAAVQAADSDSVDEYSVRCGFRDFRVVNGYFRLNGRRVFVRSTHTGNHCPVGQVIPPRAALDLLRRDLLYAKTSGLNIVRFIAGVAHPWQLDVCDELGLMVYEESLAGWCLKDSPQMGARFDFSIREMIRRDRNHPSVVIWGLLNETFDGPVFQHAQASLPLIRSLDDTRLVLLGSGRWDCQPGIGSVSNPGSSEWEHVWGIEAPAAPPVSKDWDRVHGGYFDRAGDAHVYPPTPHPSGTLRFIRTLGHDTKPVFLSEYGIGSVMNAIRELRLYEQAGVNLDAEDAVLMRSMAERFVADWHRFGLDGVYAFPEEMLRESQRLHARQRLLGFDLIRSNPHICGYNLTGMLDHGMTGEGVWTFWREWKPGVMDAMKDGWAPLRWCLFVEPVHGYMGRPFTVDVVLANEDVLQPGDYPVCARIVGSSGIVWERQTTVSVPWPPAGEDGPLAVLVLREEVRLDGPAGVYELAVTMERGGGPAGGRITFYVSETLKGRKGERGKRRKGGRQGTQ